MPWESKLQFEANAWDDAWRIQHERFANSVTARVEPHASARQGRAVQTLIDAIYRSAAEGREVEIAP